MTQLEIFFINKSW